MKTFTLHMSTASSIKDQKNELHLNLSDITRSLTAEVPAQFVDALKLNAGDLCLVKMEMSKVVAF